MTRGRLAIVAAALVVVAATLAWRSVGETKRMLDGARTCEAVGAADWDAALAASESLETLAEHPASLGDAAVCRCVALEKSGKVEACNALLDGWLLDPSAGGWLPDLPRTLRWAGARAQEGRLGDAAAVLERARAQHPDDADLTGRAFAYRLRSDPRPETIATLEAVARTLSGRAAMIARFTLAEPHHESGDHAGEYAIFAGFEPDPNDPQANVYRLSRLFAAADAGDIPAVVAERDAWRALPGQTTNANLGYAVALSMTSQADPEGHSWIELLTPDLASPSDDASIVTLAYQRLIGQLAVEGRAPEALALYERARVRFPEVLSTNADELERLSGTAEWDATERAAGASTLRFLVDHPVEGATLYVSPGRGRPSSAAWGRFAIVGGTATVHRTLDATPVRWVYRSETTTYASGATWPTAPVLDVPVTVRGAGTPRLEAGDLAPASPPDGHRRVWMVFLDCGDWRLTSYLRQRGELPTLDALLRTGWRATTLQEPAFTAAAVDGLTHPDLRRSRTTLARIDQLGLELAGLESIGENPFSGLERLLPMRRDLFQTLGAGEHRAANLIFAHGAIEGGRNGWVTGPQGAETKLPLGTMKRPLTADEGERYPKLVATDAYSESLRSLSPVIAAQFDTLLAFEDNPPFDVLLFRVEALDPLTHQYFADTSHTGQDDGSPALLEVYRYIDLRLGEVARKLDQDDVLIVMSDHGIQVSMVHDPIAMFVAWGKGVPTGRVTGTPAVRGISRSLADLLGEPTNWPDYGLVPWAAQWRTGEPIPLTESAALNPEATP